MKCLLGLRIYLSNLSTDKKVLYSILIILLILCICLQEKEKGKEMFLLSSLYTTTDLVVVLNSPVNIISLLSIPVAAGEINLSAVKND